MLRVCTVALAHLGRGPASSGESSAQDPDMVKLHGLVFSRCVSLPLPLHSHHGAEADADAAAGELEISRLPSGLHARYLEARERYG